MPEKNFQLKTEYASFSSVLIVDERGDFSSLLVDALLSHGCSVYYWGKARRESFYYLEDKKNFYYLENLSLEDIGGNIGGNVDYFFYFPSESLAELQEVYLITGEFSAKLLVCAELNFSQRKKLKELVNRGDLNSRIAYFESLFGPRIKSGLLGELFTAAAEGRQIQMDENPGKEVSPLFAKELIKELMRLAFSAETKNREYFFQTEKLTLESFTLILKKYFPRLDFVFQGKNLAGEEAGSEAKDLRQLKVDFDLEEKIQETVDWFKRNSVTTKEPEQVKTVAQPVSPPKPAEEEGKLDFIFTPEEKKENLKLGGKPSCLRKILLAVGLFVLLLMLLFFLPIGLASLSGLTGLKKISQIETTLSKGDFALALKEAQQAERLVDFSRKTVLLTGPFYSLVGLDKQVEITNKFFAVSENLIDSLKYSFLGVQEVTSLAKSFLSGEEVSWTEVLGSVKADLSFAYEQSSLAQAGLEKVEPGFNWLGQSAYFDQIKSGLPQLRKILLKGEKLLTILPKILGVGDKKTYLVLLQNNMELRPTGGFVGSFGVVRLENGKLINFEVFDVYQADGQLKGHVEPPPKLKEYLGEASWYLRDSNWDPDFPVSARRAQWFLDKEMQITSDGAIAVNLEVVRRTLAALGEIELPDYREKINQENLFQKAEYYSELGTFPGSSQKKDFLGSLVRMIFEKAKQVKGKELIDLCGAIFSSLDQKEMMFYSNDSEIESSIANLEWEGSIRSYQSSVTAPSIFTDYLSLVETNVGIDKANYYLKRNIEQQILIDQQGKVQEKLTLTYENQSPSESWPAGRYKNYLRVYLKKGAKLTSVFITDPSNVGLWLPFDINYIDESEEHGKSIFGLLFEVPIKSRRKLEINFELSDSIDFSPKLTSFLFMVQKQSGAYPSNYDLTISYPVSFVPLRVIPSAIVGHQQLLISNKLNRDLIYQIDLAH